MRRILIAILTAACMLIGAGTAFADESTTVYRLYNPGTSEHLYTPDWNECCVLYQNYNWGYEGISWTSPQDGTPVYRLFNADLNQHLYTSDTNEISVLTSKYGWVSDNNGKPLFYSAPSNGTATAIPIYRVYNEPLGGVHHFTADAAEYNALPKYGWKQEGISMYALQKCNPYSNTHFWPYYKGESDPINVKNAPKIDASGKQPAESQSIAGSLKVASKTDQIVMVRATGTNADLSLHERVNGAWRYTLSAPAKVGTGGVGTAREMAPITPRGAFGLGFAFGAAPNPGTAMEYRQTNWDTVWVDDPNSRYYNQWVNVSQVSNRDWRTAEQLVASPTAYKYAAFIQYNTNPVVSGAGSSFFLHCHSSTPSEGCITVEESVMVQLLKHLRNGAMIVIDNGDAVMSY